MKVTNQYLIILFFLCLIFSSNYPCQQISSKEKNTDQIQSNASWIDFTKPHLKIGVAADGIYRVYYENLVANGFNPANINPNKLVMLSLGEKVPIYIKGKDDNKFDPDDYIEFVGIRNMGWNHRQISEYNQPYNEYLGRYTDTTVYWLTWRENETSSTEIFENNSSLIPKSMLDFYSEIMHYERNIALDYPVADLIRKELPYWIENKTWIESLLNAGTKSYQFTVSDISPDKKGYLLAKILDYASDKMVDPHIAAIAVNNSPYYDTTKIGRYQHEVLKAEISTSQLNEGNNVIKIQSLATNSSINVLAIDWVELEYARKLKAKNDSLSFAFPFLQEKNIYQVKISNVLNEQFSVWKFGKKGKKYSYSKSGNEITFIDTISSSDRFTISSINKIKSPKYYYTKVFTDLGSDKYSHDYILITHKKFKNNVQEYLRFITNSYNHKVILIDVDDIYDQYSFGFFNPEAIREFLRSAYNNWQPPKLKYVCLVGGATYDYHGNKATYQGAPRFYNYVPSFGSPVSDTWFVVFDSSKTLIPEISIGRIPVTTNQEFDWYFQKHKDYLSQPYNAWNKRVIFFSGGTGNDQSQIDALRNVNEFIINNYVSPKPLASKYTHFYKTINPVNNFGPYSQKQITSAIDSGGVFISYLGHSGTQTWDNSITDPKQLQNKVDRYPLITDFGCSTARFAEPDVISFSQSFVNNGQAIAYIANSSLGFTSTSYSFPQIFYKKLLADSVYTIGDAHRLAKLELISKYGTSGVYQLFTLTNTLIGDPVIKLKLPQKPNLVIDKDNIRIIDKNFSDTQDSLNVKVVYNNFGLATSNTYKILIQAYYKNTINYTREIIKPLPEYVDSVTLKIPVKGLNGEHKISVTLDSGGSVNEIYENDNVASMDFIVPSGSVKYLVASQVENYVKNPLRILSPLKEKNLPDVIVELATDENFRNSTKYQIRLDTIKTDFNIDNSFANKRAWMRTKLNQYDSTASVISLKPTNKNSFAIFDSLSFSKQNYANFKVGNKLTLDSIYISFKLLSAGLNDGNTALILKDGQNHIPENTLRGHHVAIFKGKNYQFAGYKLFDVYGGGSAVTNEYIKFLDTLSSDYLVAFTLSDEGTISSTPLRNKIKEFGSKYIDNVSFRSSWVMLGRKGAKTGSVPEKYAKQYQGRVEVDTVILSNSRTGKLQTNTIGPAGKWKQLNLGLTGATNYFGLSLLGANGVNYDTLISTTDRKVNYDLSAINPVKYPYLKVNLSLGSENINDVIKFDSLIVDYLKPPELVISNRTTTISKDTLRQGEKITLIYPVYNSGETTAKNFKVTHQIVRSDGYKIMESGAAIDSLKPDERKNLSVIYDTRNLIGSYYFVINLDPDRSLNEIYTDNNYLTVPFYVKGDESIPLVQVKFDDVDIFDGDFISSTPDIKISLSSSSIIPLTDTTSIEIQLNNERIYFKNNSTINYSFADTNPKMIINYKPVLDEGEYLFKVVAKNPNNSTMESTTVQKKFLVSKNAKLLYVYNYPNPFSDETFFTFKLTQIPDELKIRIYTLAGRLIKEIVRNEGELNYDFNRIEWDGKDEDGSSIANGVYIYKVIMKKGSEVITATQKLAVIR